MFAASHLPCFFAVIRGSDIMEILTLERVGITYEDLVAASAKNGRVPSEDMIAAAKRAACEGSALIELRSVYEIYKNMEIASGSEVLELCGGSGAAERVHIGPKIGYLYPAKEIVIAICTAGKAIADAMRAYSESGDYLMMYYLDSFGVRALAEMSSYMRSHVERIAGEKGWGVGPSMQPGSVQGWDVTGQNDLYRLGHGSALGLTLNESSFLVPQISNSALIGIGPHYTESKIGSMCHECPRQNECLWRRENVKD